MVAINGKGGGKTGKVLRVNIGKCAVFLVLIGVLPYLIFFSGVNKSVIVVSNNNVIVDSPKASRRITQLSRVSNKKFGKIPSNSSVSLDHRRPDVWVPTTKYVPLPLDPKKPILVLHVGPAKTGTTSLQKMLEYYQKPLMLDNFYYAGQNSSHISNPFDGLCLRRIKNAKLDCWNDFSRDLSIQRIAGHNVVLSNEVISLQAAGNQIIWNLLKQTLKPWLPNVRVVVGYRHLHNFVPSTHFELQKNQRWPSAKERGKPVTPFTRFYQDQYDRATQFSGPIPTPAATIRWFDPFFNVSVLDIENKEQVTEFLCHILPLATNTCRVHKKESPGIPSLNRNDNGQVNYDALSIVAFQKDMLKKEQTRKYLRMKVKDYNERVLNRGFNDFPLDCLTPKQEQELFDLSLQHARDCGINQTESALRENFEKTKAKKKFCSINATMAFQAREWSEFFANAKNW